MIDLEANHDGRDRARRAADFAPHRSRLPDWLYILSFAPPVPPLFSRRFLRHPFTLYLVGSTAAICAGPFIPAMDLVYGYWTDGIIGTNEPFADIVSRGSSAALWTVLVAVLIAILLAFSLFCCEWTRARRRLNPLVSMAGLQLADEMRAAYTAAVVVQDRAYLDEVGHGELVSHVKVDLAFIQSGFGERLCYLLEALSRVLICLVSSFAHTPRLGGLMFAFVLVAGLATFFLGRQSDRLTRAIEPLNNGIANMAEQACSAMRIVQSFGMNRALAAKMDKDLAIPARQLATRRGAAHAASNAVVYSGIWFTYVITFWYGGVEHARGASVGDVLVTTFNSMTIFITVPSVMPHYNAFRSALQSISVVRQHIERKPSIDIRDNTGVIPTLPCAATFQFENVSSVYPSRRERKALDGASFAVSEGSFTAMVGPSGSGKSTVASLMLRLYDPSDPALPSLATADAGTVRFASHDVRSLNTRWLRSKLAVVVQSTPLLKGSIFDNVAAGLAGTDLECWTRSDSSPAAARPEPVKDRVEQALRIAQAWDFVQALPHGWDTEVASGRVGSLSGGQVQRIALAAAVARRPTCLILDEATSAVAPDVENKIYAALAEEQRSRHMTLVVIAHRLSSIAAADKIIVMEAGRVTCSGTYRELLDPGYRDSTFRDMALGKGQQRQELDLADQSQDDASFAKLEPSQDTRRVGARMTAGAPPVPTSMAQVLVKLGVSLGVGVPLGIATGVIFGVTAWMMGHAVQAMRDPDTASMRTRTLHWALWFLLPAFSTVALCFAFAAVLGHAGARLAWQLQRACFGALLRREVSYFEAPLRGLGHVVADLSDQPAALGNMFGVVLPQMIIIGTVILTSLGFSFALSWRLAVMVLPALAVCMSFGYLDYRCRRRHESETGDGHAAVVDEVQNMVDALPLITALSLEAATVRNFRDTLRRRPTEKRWLALADLFVGAGRGTVMLFIALVFYWGADLLAKKKIAINEVYSVYDANIIAVFMSAAVLTYGADISGAMHARATIQGWLAFRKQTQGPILPGEAQKLDPTVRLGICFENAELRYPARPETKAIDQLSLSLEYGKSYAFCGANGAGKTSIINLLQRFYDVSSGAVYLDGVDIRRLDIDKLRARMAYVSQDPVLFAGTCRWNLLAGSLEPDLVTDADLAEACEQAGILSFVNSLPHGLDTDLGVSGGHLSGGQKQRLCLARAFLRKADILLLDEVTSSLDGISEAAVQGAIDKAARGRLTIQIAHRLSTIKHADVIHVMDKGAIVESGSHEDLLSRRGRYWEQVKAQAGEP